MVSEAIIKISGLESSFWRREGDGSYHNLTALSYRVRLTTSANSAYSDIITRSMSTFTPPPTQAARESPLVGSTTPLPSTETRDSSCW